MRKGLLAIMILICLTLGAGAVWLYLSEDKQGPEITIPEAAMSYQEGDNYEALLEGVTAFDDMDGDVSDTLRVEEVFPSAGSKSATVIYVAKDTKNNISKADKIVSYTPMTEETSVSSQVSSFGNEGANPPEDLISEEENELTSEPTQVPEGNLTDIPESGAPQITLTDSEVTVQRGAAVNRLIYVEDITDDKDSRDSLFRNIQVDGNINSAVSGSYELTYYVVDSDGNKSNETKLLVTVE